MLNDVTPPLRSPDPRKSRWLILATALFIACSALAAVLLHGEPSGNAPKNDVSRPENSIKTTGGVMQRGETISSLLGYLFSPAEIHDLAQSCNKVYPLRSICAGRSYELALAGDKFERFSCDIDDTDQLVVVRDEDGFSASREPIPYAVEVETVRGTIESSLFEAVLKTGGSDALAMTLADVFAWDIDFFHDIQPGDSFEMVFEKRTRDGKPAGDGHLLAARFTTQGELYQAYWFKDGNHEPGYYDGNGRSLRKAFLRAPLSYSRISSGFNLHRLHPITHRISAHPAIDFAAPTGTPIHTVGDGTVIFAAYKKYNGNCVKVRHPNGWVTMYNHMSRFGRKIRTGKKVGQGQVIGYVGSTGRATGPHLDYRMYRHGKPVNPLKVKSPPARPVSPANMAEFKAMVAKRVAAMDHQPAKDTARLNVTGPGA